MSLAPNQVKISAGAIVLGSIIFLVPIIVGIVTLMYLFDLSSIASFWIVMVIMVLIGVMVDLRPCGCFLLLALLLNRWK